MVTIRKITTSPVEVEITGATLLSLDEFEILPPRLKRYPKWWWLRTSGLFANSIACGSPHDAEDSVDIYGNSVINPGGCIRPALYIRNINLSNINVGDMFIFNGLEFEVVSETVAFCKEDIGCCAYRNNYKAYNSTEYDLSDVKKIIDEWFKNAKKCNEKG